MANPEHLAAVKQGAAKWNAWRREHPDVQPDLNGADLERSDLEAANLRRASLIEAHLRGALLIRTNFNVADLNGADLSGTDLLSTSFGDCDLSAVVGLEECRHLGPSILDFRTIAKSGELPHSFLRGVGLPDRLIDYLPSLLDQPIQFYSCFISCSSQDDEFCRRLHADLQDNGVRCWFAPEDLKIGDRFRQKIDDSIRLHDKLLLVLSRQSVESTWVETEVESALERERQTGRLVLFPIRIDDGVMQTTKAWAGDIRRTRHIGDFSGWKDHEAYQTALKRLLRDLSEAAAKPAADQ